MTGGDVVARVRAALEGVTDGPWEWDDVTPDDRGIIWPDELRGVLQGRWHNDQTAGIDVEPADAKFIAAARELVPELAAALEQERADHAQAVEDWGVNDEQILAENARLAAEVERLRAENGNLRKHVPVELDSDKDWIDRDNALWRWSSHDRHWWYTPEGEEWSDGWVSTPRGMHQPFREAS